MFLKKNKSSNISTYNWEITRKRVNWKFVTLTYFKAYYYKIFKVVALVAIP